MTPPVSPKIVKKHVTNDELFKGDLNVMGKARKHALERLL
jgi:hypothetical protein